MTINPDFIMQIMGTIIQAYASMLAILGAFYVFQIEKNKIQSDYQLKEIELLYNNAVKMFIINKMRGINDPKTNILIDSYKNDIIKEGDKKLKELITVKLNRQETDYENIIKSEEYEDFIKKINESKSIDSDIKKISKNLYLPYAGLYVLILMLASFVMSSITFLGILDPITFFAKIITALSVAGFISFFTLLVSVYRYE